MLPTPKLGTSSIALTVCAYTAVHASVIKEKPRHSTERR